MTLLSPPRSETSIGEIFSASVFYNLSESRNVQIENARLSLQLSKEILELFFHFSFIYRITEIVFVAATLRNLLVLTAPALIRSEKIYKRLNKCRSLKEIDKQ